LNTVTARRASALFALIAEKNRRNEGNEMAHKAFKDYKLTDQGFANNGNIGEAFDELATKLEALCAPGRELAIVMTKLEEACFFAKKSNAEANSQ
jgi:hypothetical protein